MQNKNEDLQPIYPRSHNLQQLSLSYILETMMFSSKTCRFICFFFLSVSTNAETLRGVERELNPDPDPVDLGVAGDYAILTKAGISTTGVTSITGNIGVSPIAATAMTGFALSLDPTTQFATSPQIVGADSGGNVHRAHAASYGGPVSVALTTAVSDMQTAYTDAAGRANDFENLDFGILDAKTLLKGVYKFDGAVTLSGVTTFSDIASKVSIFQIAGDLVVKGSTVVNPSNTADAKNIIWQVAGSVLLEEGAHMEGIILTATKVVIKKGASLNGRVLAQTACTLDATTITVPV
jgi:cytoskeletal protein CcmA (bactofilin family)